MKIGPARISDDGHGFNVEIEGHRFFNGEKYTIIEQGWAVYIARDELPEAWMRLWGETKPGDDEWSELVSDSDMLITSHPVLVALVILWHHHTLGEKPIPEAPDIPIPTWDEAVEIVRNREILNDFNEKHAGAMPGLRRWSPRGERLW